VRAFVVEYFALFREQAGCAEERVESDASTVAALFAECARRHGFADARERCKVAVDDELVAWETPLAGGERILFFPPVAGG
jgi:molybdopterin converting factor subunit 1